MKEIFTLNLGFSGNFSSSYFWQIQDMYSMPLDFHKAFFVQTSEGYFPRMLGADYKESLSLPVALSKQESEILWSGKITKIDQDQETEEKWSDLLSGMISRKNLLPIYRDFPAAEELEDQIRYFAESADNLQGIHTLSDNEFSNLLIDGLGIIEDFYPKVPNLLFNFNYKFSPSEKLMLWKIGEYSNVILVPCTEVKDKVGFSQIATGIDVVSYHYRQNVLMATSLQGFLRYAQGNTCEFSLNSHNFSQPGIVFVDKTFVRQGKDKVNLPEQFPITEEPQYLAKLFQSSFIQDFYENFVNLKSHHFVGDELQEARNYLLGLCERYSDIECIDLE